MRITDFTLPADKAAQLADIDDLVNHGVSRQTSEAIVERLHKVWHEDFPEFIRLAVADLPSEATKHFIQSSLVQLIHEWGGDRIVLGTVAGRFALEALKREA